MISYINLRAGDGAKALFAAMAKHCDAEAGPGDADLKTPREMALLMVGAHLHSQFKYLCKKGVFRIPGVNSSRDVTFGFRQLEHKMHMVAYLKERFPGVCFDPREYTPRVLDKSSTSATSSTSTQFSSVETGMGPRKARSANTRCLTSP